MFEGATATASHRAPQRPVDEEAIREQLERIVSHPLFQHSQRFPAMLRYIVEKTLEGDAAQIKERIIGIEVFGRESGYNANDDPVVRMVAREIRRRLAQYYHEPAHAAEITIDLPIGSYVPIFYPTGMAPRKTETVAASAALRLKLPRRLAAAVLLFVLGMATGLLLVQHDRLFSRQGNQDLLWAPLLEGQGPVTICVGEPGVDQLLNALPKPTLRAGGQPQSFYDELHRAGQLALGDVVTLTRLVTVLDSHRKSYRVTTASQVDFTQLQQGPVLLIGAFDNRWTMLLTERLRFGFLSKGGYAYVIDRRNAGQTSWSTMWDAPYGDLERDFAIVARFHDATTNQPVLMAAGIGEEGTVAAGQILSDPGDLALLLRNAPQNWRAMNMEAVLETDVIAGQAGPPRVLAVEFW